MTSPANPSLTPDPNSDSAGAGAHPQRILLVGGGGVIARCADGLLAAGHRVVAVLTQDATAREWAVKAGVRHLTLTAALTQLSGLRSDLLLSVGNLSLVPDELIAAAVSGGVNYHYGPLPHFAGLNAPSWAIAEGVTEYAITWHAIGGPVDGGDVLRTVPVALDARDTGLSLGLKCDDAAVASVVSVVDMIANGTAVAVPQDLSSRRYFGRYAQPPAEGLIDWTAPAAPIVAGVRATQFGQFDGPLTWSKAIFGEQLVAIREAVVVNAGTTEAGAAEPGRVLACSSADGLIIAAGEGAVRVLRISTLEGADVPISELMSSRELSRGALLPTASVRVRDGLTEAGARASRSAAFWRGELVRMVPARLPYPIAGHGDAAVDQPRSTDVVVASCPLIGGGTEPLHTVAAALSLFLARAGGQVEAGTVEVAIAADLADLDAAHRSVFSAWLPFLARVEPAAGVGRQLAALAEQAAELRARGPLRRDAIGRDNTLRRRFGAGELIPDIVIHGAESVAPFGARIALVPTAGELVEFRFDPARTSAADVSRLAAQFSDWCRRLADADDVPLAELTAMPAQEHERVVVAFNATGEQPMLGHCLPALFAEAAEAHPDKVAAVCGADSRTYAQLNADAHSVARALRARGVAPGDLVGVSQQRSVELVVAVLGVLLAGAAYVPIDPSFPDKRIAAMLADARPKLVLGALDPGALAYRA